MADFPSDLTDLASHDEQLRARVVGFFNEILDEFDHILNHGNTQAKVTLMRAAIPQLMKLVQTEKSDDELADMKQEMEKMRTELSK